MRTDAPTDKAMAIRATRLIVLKPPRPRPRPSWSKLRSGSRRERVLVGARPIDRWHRHVQQPQVHGQLTAVVNPMVHHDRPDEHRFRHGHQRLTARFGGPRPLEAFVAQLPELFLHGLDALIVRRKDVRGRRRRWRLLALELGDILAAPAGNDAGARRDVQRQLAERHRFGMRLPRKLVGRHALEHAARRTGLVVEFLKNGGTHRHGGTLLSWNLTYYLRLRLDRKRTDRRLRLRVGERTELLFDA